MTEVTFTDAAIDDLRRIGPDAVPKVLKKVLILLDSPDAGYPLGGELAGFRKLVVGRNTWRIVYLVVDEKQIEICEVWAVSARRRRGLRGGDRARSGRGRAAARDPQARRRHRAPRQAKRRRHMSKPR
jgi:mRNA interferase RelE/StbE